RRAQVGDFVEALGHPQVVLSEGIVGAGKEFLCQVSALGLEGVVAKRLDSRYRPGKRTRTWIKIKRPRGVHTSPPTGCVDLASMLRRHSPTSCSEFADGQDI